MSREEYVEADGQVIMLWSDGTHIANVSTGVNMYSREWMLRLVRNPYQTDLRKSLTQPQFLLQLSYGLKEF